MAENKKKKNGNKPDIDDIMNDKGSASLDGKQEPGKTPDDSAKPESDSTSEKNSLITENKEIATPVTTADKFKNSLKIVIPSIVVLVCAIVVGVLLSFEISSLGDIQGVFTCNNVKENNSWIKFDQSGNYTFSEGDGGIEISGTWESNGDRVTLRPAGASSTYMFYIDGKYLAFDDESFLSGDVPDESVFEASFTSGDGTTYVFDKEGKCYTAEEGRNTELGKYMTDGSFIIITIDNVAYTYLNCGEGLAPVFYTQS